MAVSRTLPMQNLSVVGNCYPLALQEALAFAHTAADECNSASR